MYTAKKQSQSNQIQNSSYYELFTTEQAQTPDGQTIDILKSIGTFNKYELQNQNYKFTNTNH